MKCRSLNICKDASQTHSELHARMVFFVGVFRKKNGVLKKFDSYDKGSVFKSLSPGQGWAMWPKIKSFFSLKSNFRDVTMHRGTVKKKKKKDDTNVIQIG